MKLSVGVMLLVLFSALVPLRVVRAEERVAVVFKESELDALRAYGADAFNIGGTYRFYKIEPEGHYTATGTVRTPTRCEDASAFPAELNGAFLKLELRKNENGTQTAWCYVRLELPPNPAGLIENWAAVEAYYKDKIPWRPLGAAASPSSTPKPAARVWAAPTPKPAVWDLPDDLAFISFTAAPSPSPSPPPVQPPALLGTDELYISKAAAPDPPSYEQEAKNGGVSRVGYMMIINLAGILGFAVLAFVTVIVLKRIRK